ncbi:CaiB/BaiF CoA-transferase family protein [Microlunatus sp. Gsoil 973]|uniref:CaiB/BaiF CoA transferase family protein n=1 Tax=Microlunatus sp. Gsoil 973 TaxID=2672569 RepID=UPI0012B491F8|nr:CaiB/BaiF CoA-transferase family protein [Microlunatus sp. Gsoil 973]QGN32373.1 CoA transferase [Microlunatus sp. Gsoil 973]
MTGPLSGVHVLELPAIGPVPFLGMLLSDLGATVTRIDRPDGTPNGLEFPPRAVDRGRRSIGLDLRKPGAAEVAGRLIERSDVLIEGFRPGVAERLGVGPEAAMERNPALVYGRMTGWGQDGPLAGQAGHDITYLAISGVLHGIGEHDRRPIPPVNYLADFGGGALVLATGVLAALLHARATGEGQVIDAAMTEGAAYLSTMTRQFQRTGDWIDERGRNLLDGGAPNYRCYACSDGGYVAVGALEPKFWAELVRVLGADPGQVPSPYERDQWAACADWLGRRFATRSRDEWETIFAGTDACVAPVLTLAEAPEHPHNRARRSFVELDGGQVAAPVPRFSQTNTTVGPVAGRGAETDLILDELGISGSERDRLRAEGVLL